MRNIVTDQWFLPWRQVSQPVGGWAPSNTEKLEQLRLIVTQLAKIHAIKHWSVAILPASPNQGAQPMMVTDGAGALALMSVNLKLQPRRNCNGIAKYNYPKVGKKPEKPAPRVATQPSRRLNIEEIINTNKD